MHIRVWWQNKFRPVAQADMQTIFLIDKTGQGSPKVGYKSSGPSVMEWEDPADCNIDRLTVSLNKLSDVDLQAGR